MKNLSFFHKLIYFLNVPFGFILLLSYLANFINPSIMPWVGLLGLGYPIWLVVNALFSLFWIISLKRQFLFSFVCILIGYPQFSAFFQFEGSNRAFAEEDEPVKVMSYNVQTFSKQLFTNWQESAIAIRNVINQEDADIACFQEYYENPETPRFNYRYKHIVFTNKSFGLAIMSKFKMIHKGEVAFNNNVGVYGKFIYADILKGEDTIRVINTHLLSIGLDSKNLSALSGSEISQHELEKQKQKLLKPLLRGYKGRGDQAKKLGDFIEESPYKVILCGDFNATPGSYSYRQVSSQLKDTFVESGIGFSTTLPSFHKYKFPLRIDHIFVSEELVSYNHEVIEKGFSDHYPVVVDLIF